MDKLEIKRALLYNKPSILDSQPGGNQCFSGPNKFLPDLSVGPACLGISDFSHKPVGLLTCDILEVHGRFYWPGPSGLWLSWKTRMHALVDDPSWNIILSLFNCLIFLEQNYKN